MKARALFLTVSLLLVANMAISANTPHLHLTVHYRSISFRDFIVDGPTLAKETALVELVGAYTRDGNVSVLYESMNSLALARYGPAGMPSPQNIPLLTENASHQFREMQYSCDSRAAYGLGCMMVIRGIATTCALTNTFGAETDSPCIEVIDGDDGVAPRAPSPPPPTSSPPPAAPEESPAPAPQTYTTAKAPISPESFEQQVRDCIRSPEMADADDVYRKCMAQVRGKTPPP